LPPASSLQSTIYMQRNLRLGASSRHLASLLVASLATFALARPAAADGDARDTDARWPGLSYLWDGGALPFFWAPAAGTMALNRWVSPRGEPLLFSESEGGAQVSGWSVPNWSVLGTGVTTGLAMGLSGDAAGWYHAKGLAQSLATGELITTSLKLAVGRHRPDWSSTDTNPTQQRSFPSGHSTKAFAIATYAALYLHEHVFDGLRGGKLFVGGMQGLTYGALAAAATTVALERVYHNRHHASDVLAGAALGTAESTLFFLYQEHRFRHRGGDRGEPALTIASAGSGPGATLQLGGVF
jgi:membrane-associated phospholipid phosphatase